MRDCSLYLSKPAQSLRGERGSPKSLLGSWKRLEVHHCLTAGDVDLDKASAKINLRSMRCQLESSNQETRRRAWIESLLLAYTQLSNQLITAMYGHNEISDAHDNYDRKDDCLRNNREPHKQGCISS